jgi:O-antigen/teichoic acid export membrane protein
VEKSLFKNFIYKLVLSFFNVIVPILVIPYVYRVIGSDGIGKVEYANSLFMYFFLIGGLGIYSYGMREVSAVRDDPAKIRGLFSSLLVIAVLSNFIALAAFLGFILIKTPSGGVSILLFILAANFLSNIIYVEWLNEAFENFGFITVKTVAVRLISVAALFLFVRTPSDVWVYLSVMTAYTFVNNLASFCWIGRRIGFTLRAVSVRRHIRPLIYITVMTNGWLLYGQLDRLFLGSYSSMDQVAWYGAASKIIDILFPFLMAVVAVTAPRLSYYLAGDRANYDSLISRIASMALFVMIPASVGVFMLSDEIIFVLGGEQFAPASLALRILAFDMTILSVERILTNNVLFMFRKERLLNFIIIGFGLANLAAKYVMRGSLTAANAMAVMVVVHLSLTIVQYVYARKKLEVHLGIFCGRNLLYLCVSLLFVPVVFAVKHYIPLPIPAAAVSVAACGVLYWAALFLAKDANLLLLQNKAFSMLLSLRGRAG